MLPVEGLLGEAAAPVAGLGVRGVLLLALAALGAEVGALDDLAAARGLAEDDGLPALVLAALGDAGDAGVGVPGVGGQAVLGGVGRALDGRGQRQRRDLLLRDLGRRRLLRSRGGLGGLRLDGRGRSMGRGSGVGGLAALGPQREAAVEDGEDVRGLRGRGGLQHGDELRHGRDVDGRAGHSEDWKAVRYYVFVMLSKPLTLAPSLFNFFIPQEAGGGGGGMLGTMEGVAPADAATPPVAVAWPKTEGGGMLGPWICRLPKTVSYLLHFVRRAPSDPYGGRSRPIWADPSHIRRRTLRHVG